MGCQHSNPVPPSREEIASLVRRVAGECSGTVPPCSGAIPTYADSPTAVPPVSAFPRVVVASDHGGFEMKELLKKHLGVLQIECKDLGPASADPVDYPDFASAVASAVARGEASCGIMIDGAGIGSAMVANKVRGIRAAHCTHSFEVKNARRHNNANVLTLGGRVIGIEVAKELVKLFVETPFEGGRHAARVQKIMDREKDWRS